MPIEYEDQQFINDPDSLAGVLGIECVYFGEDINLVILAGK